MGVKSIDALWKLMHDPAAELGDADGGDFIGTNVLWHVHIPLRLPPIQADLNRVGGLQYVGYTLFVLVAGTALAFILWAFVRRKVRVVRVAQPLLLVKIAVSVLIMAASMIPAGMDDLASGGICAEDGSEGGVSYHCQAICMRCVPSY
jgi:hypothetical protein